MEKEKNAKINEKKKENESKTQVTGAILWNILKLNKLIIIIYF